MATKKISEDSVSLPTYYWAVHNRLDHGTYLLEDKLSIPRAAHQTNPGVNMIRSWSVEHNSPACRSDVVCYDFYMVFFSSFVMSADIYLTTLELDIWLIDNMTRPDSKIMGQT